MERGHGKFLFLVLLALSVPTPTYEYKAEFGQGFMFKHEPNFQERKNAEKALNTNILSVINHFKKEKAQGIDFVRDPLTIESLKDKISGVTFSIQDPKVYGLSHFKVTRLEADLSELKVNITLSIDELKVLGRYKVSAWISKHEGACDVSISNAELTIDAKLMIDEEGLLQVRKSESEITYDTIETNFEKLGIVGKWLKGLVNKVGGIVFDGVKPVFQEEFEGKLVDIINSEARDIPKQFPTSINPVDITLVQVRKLIKQKQLDPLLLADYSTQKTQWSHFELYNGKLEGLSNIRRSGPILLGFEKDVAFMTIHLGVENLEGTYQWGWTGWRGVLGRRGQLKFLLDHVSVEIHLQQPAGLDKPIVDAVNVTFGPTQITSRGIGGAIEYILEMIFNVVPNVFRQRIADAAEHSLIQVLEDEIVKLDMDKWIEDNETVEHI